MNWSKLGSMKIVLKILHEIPKIRTGQIKEQTPVKIKGAHISCLLCLLRGQWSQGSRQHSSSPACSRQLSRRRECVRAADVTWRSCREFGEKLVSSRLSGHPQTPGRTWTDWTWTPWRCWRCLFSSLYCTVSFLFSLLVLESSLNKLLRLLMTD